MRLSIEPGQVEMGARNPGDSGFSMVPTEGVEPTHPHGYQILSLARLPIPPHRPNNQLLAMQNLSLFSIAPQSHKSSKTTNPHSLKNQLDRNIKR